MPKYLILFYKQLFDGLFIPAIKDSSLSYQAVAAGNKKRRVVAISGPGNFLAKRKNLKKSSFWSKRFSQRTQVLEY